MSHPHLKIQAHLSPSEVKSRYQNCLNAVEKIHWQAIWLLGKEDSPLNTEEVAKVIGYSPGWVRRIARRYNEEGPDGIEDKRKHNGVAPLLNEDQMKQLEDKVSGPAPDGGLWTGRKVALAIKEIIGRKVSLVTGWNYLNSIGFTLQVPRPSHTKAATDEEQEAFKKNSKRISMSYKKSSPKKK